MSYILQSIFSAKKINLFNKQYTFDKKQKSWLDNSGNKVLDDILSYRKKIERMSNFKYHRRKKKWLDENGNDFLNPKCDHLLGLIKKKYEINISPGNWQHWNGGVFLFNKNSIDFLASWHNKTLDSFNDPDWKTRDQGTLASTVWKFGLSNHKLLPDEFNFITDFYKPQISYNKTQGFTNDNFKNIIHPNFLHVYHHFGDKNWDVWQAIESIKNDQMT